jgi:hypothetical protein
MRGLTLVLVVLTAVLGPIGMAGLVHPMVNLIVPVTAIVTVLTAARSPSVRATWGSLCLMNGVTSLALAGASVQNGQLLWPDPVYEPALDQAMRW